MRVSSFSGLLLSAFLLSANPATADDNEPTQGCPFEAEPSGGDDGNYEPSGWDDDTDTSSSDSDSVDWGTDSDWSTSSSESCSTCSGGCGGGGSIDLEWPEALGLRLSGGYGTWDWSEVDFAGPGSFTLDGASLALGAVDLAGGELVIEYAPTRVLRLGAGGGIWGPVGGQAGGDLGPSVLDGDAQSSGLTVFDVFAEGGFVQRVGGLTVFAAMRLGMMHANVDIESDCGCNGQLDATRLVVGPRFGVRAPLYRSLYLSGAVFADVQTFPDYVATLGVGFGRRAL